MELSKCNLVLNSNTIPDLIGFNYIFIGSIYAHWTALYLPSKLSHSPSKTNAPNTGKINSSNILSYVPVTLINLAFIAQLYNCKCTNLLNLCNSEW